MNGKRGRIEPGLTARLPALVRGWEGMFPDMVERPEWVRSLCRKLTDFYLENHARAAELAGGRIDLHLIINR